MRRDRTPIPPRARFWRGAVAGVALLALPAPALAGTLRICRTFDIASPLMTGLLIPASTLFRDNGRSDDPLAAFTRDYWQLRLETVAEVVLQPLQECVPVLVRVTSDSSVKGVAPADNRMFVYAGSNNLLDAPQTSEDLFSLKGAVMDQVN
jgi:hypothetical protein